MSRQSLLGKKFDAENVSFKEGGIGEVDMVNMIDIRVGYAT
jgi:hypothetical protein